MGYRTLNQVPKALVVEDDPFTSELLQEILNTQGFEVMTAVEGESAAALFAKEPFQSIFLDLNVPGLDGLELTRRIRSSATNKSTLVVMITGSEGRKTMEDAFAAGATLFLSKPVDRRMLLRLLGMIRERGRVETRSAS